MFKQSPSADPYRSRAGRWLVALALGTAQVLSHPSVSPAAPAEVPVLASWYGPGFHGRLTANGEVYNQHDLTAAHKTLPFGTVVRVTNTQNNRQVLVRINDRGPYIEGREIDLSFRAAQELGMVDAGVVPVIMELNPNG